MYRKVSINQMHTRGKIGRLLLHNYDKRKSVDIGILLIGSLWLLGFVSFLGIIFLGNYEFSYSMSVLLCLGVFPYFYMGKAYPALNQQLPTHLRYWKILLLLAVIVIAIVNIGFGSKSLTDVALIGMRYLIVAVSEEVLFRYYIQHLLEEQCTKWGAILLQACLFAFLLHSGLPILLNLFVRLPAGVILTLIFHKTRNLSIPIVIHLLYDAIIHIIWL